MPLHVLQLFPITWENIFGLPTLYLTSLPRLIPALCSSFWKGKWKPQMWRERYYLRNGSWKWCRWLLSHDLQRPPHAKHHQNSYLFSSVPVSCSSSSQSDEGRYRWSSEIFVVPGCPWWACLSLLQGVSVSRVCFKDSVTVRDAALNSVTFMLQMSFTACQQSKHYNLGLGDIWSITTSEQLWLLITRGYPKGNYPNCSKNIHREWKTKKLLCQLAMKLDYLFESSQISTAVPAQGQKKDSYMHVVWIWLWRIVGR